MHYLALAAALAMTSAPTPIATDPAVRVKVSDERLERGDRARVHVKTARDGYLLVLRLGEDGQVRVLFPVDPGDSNFVKGGRELEIRSRGDRDAFVAGDKAGTGLILAARSDTPFNFLPFVTSHHWNADALTPATSRDHEAALVSVIDAMTQARYDYDATPYTVDAGQGGRVRAGRYGGPFYDPWFYGGYGAWPYYGPSFGIHSTVILGGRHHRR